MKFFLDHTDITVLNAELHTVGMEWNYRHVNNPYSRIYYITAGHGRIRHHDREYLLKPGHLYVIPCYTTVDMICSRQFTHYYVHVTVRLDTGLDILSLLPCTYEVCARDHGIDRRLCERLLHLNPNKALTEYDATKPIYRQVLDRANRLDREKSPGDLLATNALVRLLLAPFLSHPDLPHTDRTLDGLQRFERVFAHIRDHLHTPLTLAELAERVDLNPTYFSNLFRKLMGITPIRYINKRRVEEVQIRLLTTDETLRQIAEAVGFTDEYYLSRVFKRQVGLSPSHYRQQNLHMHQR